MVNPSNAFDANAYCAARAGQQGKPVAELAETLVQNGLSPITDYMQSGSNDAKKTGTSLVQTVPSEQRVTNDPSREQMGEALPSNYNRPTLPPEESEAVGTAVGELIASMVGSAAADVTEETLNGSMLGANQTMLEHRINDLSVDSKNMQSAQSEMKDSELNSYIKKSIKTVAEELGALSVTAGDNKGAQREEGTAKSDEQSTSSNTQTLDATDRAQARLFRSSAGTSSTSGIDPRYNSEDENFKFNFRGKYDASEKRNEEVERANSEANERLEALDTKSVKDYSELIREEIMKAAVLKPQDMAKYVEGTRTDKDSIQAQRKSPLVPGDDGYVPPPENVYDSNENPLYPPTTGDSTKANGYYRQVGDDGTLHTLNSDGTKGPPVEALKGVTDPEPENNDDYQTTPPPWPRRLSITNPSGADGGALDSVHQKRPSARTACYQGKQPEINGTGNTEQQKQARHRTFCGAPVLVLWEKFPV